MSLASSAVAMGLEPTLDRGVSVIVPVYNGEATIRILVDEILGVFGSMDGDGEILLVNDGSADGSWQEIERIALHQPNVRGINLGRNYGQHNATLCGLRNARFLISVTMDQDLEHPASEIPRMLAKLEEGWDVVYGRPAKRYHSWLRDTLSKLTKTVVGWATGVHWVVEQSPFRVFRTGLRSASTDFSGPELLFDVLLGWGTTRFTSMPVSYRPSHNGQSNYTAKRLVEMGLMVLTAHSTAPLRFAGWVGSGLIIVGVGVLTYAVILVSFMGRYSGLTFLASLMSIFSGAQLLALGLFGEYLTRIFNRALGRPTYLISEQVGGRAGVVGDAG